MRGFSLVEVVVGLALSSIVLMGMLQFSARTVQRLQDGRKRAAVHESLSLAQGPLRRMARKLEPEFWQEFPLVPEPVHPMDHTHGAVQFCRSCPEGTSSDCFTLWDIEPLDEEPLIYDVEDAAFPEMVSVTPSDISYPVGPADTIGAMSVLMFVSDTTRFCALVWETAGNQVYLAEPERQPWTLPGTFAAESFMAVHLGRLSVTHCTVDDDDEALGRLLVRSWTLSEDGWAGGRRATLPGHPSALRWVPCTEVWPDRLLILESDPKAPLLSRPVWLAGQSFVREVFCASLEF